MTSLASSVIVLIPSFLGAFPLFIIFIAFLTLFFVTAGVFMVCSFFSLVLNVQITGHRRIRQRSLLSRSCFKLVRQLLSVWQACGFSLFHAFPNCCYAIAWISAALVIIKLAFLTSSCYLLLIIFVSCTASILSPADCIFMSLRFPIINLVSDDSLQ